MKPVWIKSRFLCQAVIKILIITVNHYILYYSGQWYLSEVRFLIFYPLLPLCHSHKIFLPFFLKNYLFVYLFVYVFFFIFLMHFSWGKFFLLLYSCMPLFFFSDNYYYWEKIDHYSDYSIFMYKDYLVFPEGWFVIENKKDLNNLIDISIKKKKILIAGVTSFEYALTKKIPINGVLLIDWITGKYWYREKKHSLPFLEVDRDHFLIINEQGNFHNDIGKNIFICSEFFLFFQKNLPEKYIIVASIKWTKTIFTFWYKYVMRRIFDMYNR